MLERKRSGHESYLVTLRMLQDRHRRRRRRRRRRTRCRRRHRRRRRRRRHSTAGCCYSGSCAHHQRGGAARGGLAGRAGVGGVREGAGERGHRHRADVPTVRSCRTISSTWRVASRLRSSASSALDVSSSSLAARCTVRRRSALSRRKKRDATCTGALQSIASPELSSDSSPSLASPSPDAASTSPSCRRTACTAAHTD